MILDFLHKGFRSVSTTFAYVGKRDMRTLFGKFDSYGLTYSACSARNYGNFPFEQFHPENICAK